MGRGVWGWGGWVLSMCDVLLQKGDCAKREGSCAFLAHPLSLPRPTHSFSRLFSFYFFVPSYYYPRLNLHTQTKRGRRVSSRKHRTESSNCESATHFLPPPTLSLSPSCRGVYRSGEGRGGVRGVSVRAFSSTLQLSTVSVPFQGNPQQIPRSRPSPLCGESIDSLGRRALSRVVLKGRIKYFNNENESD